MADMESPPSLHRVGLGFREIKKQLRDLTLQQKNLTAIVREALTQLHLSRTYEKRLDRLEAAVFGKTD